ncbi:hypothetical protein KCP71_13680 [Salmonella enterica subsp. enterica]|nr:hypothetical protein KCP71_13680 [Salmonella enterica subsp. enterica]
MLKKIKQVKQAYYDYATSEDGWRSEVKSVAGHVIQHSPPFTAPRCWVSTSPQPTHALTPDKV